eukprot:TRINITY_DN33057_c0_g1_i1.p1 TRINITY_DN33057_c0_g1~~TRINITY_DN33057_c0_g1_i1.p1  ORF type:complete len:442 (-),score=71.48 TRINITY_DN33057_c0_g1_i1:54-1379(-)
MPTAGPSNTNYLEATAGDEEAAYFEEYSRPSQASVSVDEVDCDLDIHSNSSIGHLSEHSVRLHTFSGKCARPATNLAVESTADESNLSLLHTVEIGSPVLAVSMAPDGRWCFFGCSSGKAILQELATAREMCQMEHQKPVLSVAVSSTGKLLATGSDDSTAKLWRLEILATSNFLEAYCEMVQCLDHDASVFAVAFSSDSSKVVTGSWFFTVKTATIWDTASGSSLRTIEHERAGVITLALSPCDNWLVTGSFDRRLNLWHMPSLLTGEANSVADTETLLENAGSRHPTKKSGSDLLAEGACRSLRFSPDGDKLAAGFESGKVLVWLVAKSNADQAAGASSAVGNIFKPMSTLQHDDGVFALSFSSDSLLVVTATLPIIGGSVISVWDAYLDLIYFHSTLDCGVLALAVSPDANLVITGSNDKKLSMWKMSAHLPSIAVSM